MITKHIIYHGVKICHGAEIEGTIEGQKVKGKLSIDNGYVDSNGKARRAYFCQDKRDGSNASDKLGFPYSWAFDIDYDEDELEDWVEIDVSKIKDTKIAGKKVKLDESKLEPLIIDKDTKDEIIAVLRQHENGKKIFEEWGLGDVIEYGKGMTFMFYGGPGTGKTWAANCMAKAIGSELLIVSAAEIQSSEPGAANRNIQNAFSAAKSEGKVLFFDECDSLITSRNDVGMVLGSEINTILTEIEKFEGVAILATNRIETMDEALERRISLIVEFPDPAFEARKEIWKKLIPDKMPLGKGVDFDKLAEYKLTGGQIKNVILQAARLAVANGDKKVELKYIEAAIVRVNKSRNLMGQSSRYTQIKVKQDYTKGSY